MRSLVIEHECILDIDKTMIVKECWSVDLLEIHLMDSNDHVGSS